MFLINYFSENTDLVLFGVIIILSQINPFIGLEAKRNIHEVFNGLSNSLQNINIRALYVSIPSLVIIIYVIGLIFGALVLNIWSANTSVFKGLLVL